VGKTLGDRGESQGRRGVGVGGGGGRQSENGSLKN